MTRALLRSVYGVTADVEWSSATGRPAVVLGPPEVSTAPGLRALVVGGAGRGAPLLRLLVERGVHVVTGVLHGSDTDVEVAERLDVEHVSVPAFSEIDEEAAAAWRRHAAAADVVVVCDPPVGPGNVRNLELALDAAAAGTPVVLVDAVPIAERDFTGGRATERWNRIRVSATVVRTADDAVAAVLALAPRSAPHEVGLAAHLVGLADPSADLVVELALVPQHELVHPVAAAEQLRFEKRGESTRRFSQNEHTRPVGPEPRDPREPNPDHERDP